MPNYSHPFPRHRRIFSFAECAAEFRKRSRELFENDLVRRQPRLYNKRLNSCAPVVGMMVLYVATGKFSNSGDCDVGCHVRTLAAVGCCDAYVRGPAGCRGDHGPVFSLAWHHKVSHIGVTPIKCCPLPWHVKHHEPQCWVVFCHVDDGGFVGFSRS